MMMGRLAVPAVLAGVFLCGCTVPGTPAEKLAVDVANCRRHAAEGPGGPSALVGGRTFTGSALNRQNVSSLAKPAAPVAERESQWQTVFRDCLEQRGHAVPRDTNRPLDPDAVGGAGTLTIPA